MASSTDNLYFPNISKLLEEVAIEYEKEDYATMQDALNAYIRKRKYWPMIQTKKFFGKNNLLLLHNTYTRDDVDHFKNLYDEIRSVVLDFDAPSGEMIVLSLADKIPTRMLVDQYVNMYKDGDILHECFEGTMVYVYNHNEKWFFSTSTCPNINSSKYFHPTKTHGKMFDEALQELFPTLEEEKLRDTFVTYLDINTSYGFLLVHHENKHVMDYSPEFGENYKRLYHLFSRDKKTSAPILEPIKQLELYIPKQYASLDEAVQAISETNSYGFIAKSEEMVYKVSIGSIIQAETENLGNSNPWVNMLSVYMKQNPLFKINDYIDKYMYSIKNSLIQYDSNGNEMVPVYIIHTVMMTLRDIIYSAYTHTTQYDLTTQQYSIDRDLDAQYAPIIRFHLAQLRHLQGSKHKFSYINQQTVYHYLCLHQTMKNIRMLIDHVANTSYTVPFRTQECFRLLNNALHGYDTH
jgi:hypothetical protein